MAKRSSNNAKRRTRRPPSRQLKAARPEASTSPRAMETTRLKAHAEVEADRSQRILTYRRQVGSEAIRTTAFTLTGTVRPLRVLAEGDSWFDFPRLLRTGGGVVDHLERRTGLRILNVAHAGDEARQVMSLNQRRRLEQLLTDGELAFNVLLFSGGGNDLVGDQFCLWLRRRTDGLATSQAIEEPRLAAALGVVESAYRDLIALRDQCSPTCCIVTHGYDFPQPSDKGVCGHGPWLKPSLDYRGWVHPQEQVTIVREVLERFGAMLAGLEQEQDSASRPFLYVRTQGTLDASSDWHDEIHPNRQGFDKIAARFEPFLRSISPP